MLFPCPPPPNKEGSRMMQYNRGLPFAEFVELSKAALGAAQVLEPRETMESAVRKWSRREKLWPLLSPYP